jgi:hypothetical protein
MVSSYDEDEAVRTRTGSAPRACTSTFRPLSSLVSSNRSTGLRGSVTLRGPVRDDSEDGDGRRATCLLRSPLSALRDSTTSLLCIKGTRGEDGDGDSLASEDGDPPTREGVHSGTRKFSPKNISLTTFFFPCRKLTLHAQELKVGWGKPSPVPAQVCFFLSLFPPVPLSKRLR